MRGLRHDEGEQKGCVMAKAEWGVKRLCANCGAAYYDMKKNPAICPACSTPFDPEALLKSRRRVTATDESRAALTKKPVPAKEAEVDVEDIEVEEDVEVVADDAVEADADETLDVAVEEDEK
jgi:uncharacterized protein (TIGR02300 family)